MRIGGKLIFYTERSIVPEEKSDAEIRLLLLQFAEVEKMHPPFIRLTNGASSFG